MTQEMLSIGELAAATNVTVETLRYYERRLLVAPVRRRDNGYREYAPSSAALVLFIKRVQALGFTLGEVADLVRLREENWSPRATGRLRQATVEKLHEMDARIEELRGLRSELAQLIARCDESCPASQDSSPATSVGSAVRGSSGADCALVGALDTAS